MPHAIEQIEERLRPHALGQRELLTRQGLRDGGEQLAPQDCHDHAHRQQKAVADRLPLPVWGQPATRHQTVDMRVQNQGLTPRVQRREDARLRPEILRGCQQRAQGVAHGLQQQRGHPRHVGEPHRVEVVG